MPYTRVWDSTDPANSAPADQIGEEIRNLKVDLIERLNSILGHTAAATQDPVVFNQVYFGTAVASPKIFTGSTSLVFRNNTDTTTVMTLSNGGALTIIGQMSATNYHNALFTGTSFTVNPGVSAVFYDNLRVATKQASLHRYAAASPAASDTINWNNGNNQALTLTGNTTLAFSNPIEGAWYTLFIKQGPGAPFTITWPGSVAWSGGSAPTLTTTAGRTDVVSFYFDGTNYIGFVSGTNYNV